MAISLYYVDPSIAGNSGSGTSGDPYGDLQYALDSITRNATDGDQINIKAGTDEVLAAALSLASYGTPAIGAPLILRGYTSSAGDGGIGGIDGNGSYGLIAGSPDYLVLWDLHVHNGGSANLIDVDDWCFIINCEVDNTTGTGIAAGGYDSIVGCHVHNVGGVGISMQIGTSVQFCYLANGTNDFSTAITTNQGANIEFNVINIDGSSNGIQSSNASNIRNNTIYSSSGTGTGIVGSGANSIFHANYVEGFSGAGGVGINLSAAQVSYRGNRYYNNTTNASIGVVADSGDNSAVSASALKNPGSGDFRVNGDLRAGAWPSTFPSIDLPNYLDIGAVQRKEPVWLPRLRGHSL